MSGSLSFLFEPGITVRPPPPSNLTLPPFLSTQLCYGSHLFLFEPGLSEDEIRALVLTVAGKIDRVEMANSNLVKTITRLERQNMDLQKNLTDAAGENNNLRANFSSLELRLKAVEQQLEQERRENNSTDSDVLTKITDLENQILGINLIPGGSGNTNTVVSNCSCCDAYADISKDVSQLQSGQSDLLRQLKESVTNRTNLASDLVKFDSRLDSVSLRLDVLENSTTAHSGIITTLQNSLSSRCEPLQFET